MDFTTLQTVLIAVAPSVSAIITMIGGIIYTVRKIKALSKKSDKALLESETKLQKAYKDIAIIKAKCESMEKIMIEEKEKK